MGFQNDKRQGKIQDEKLLEGLRSSKETRGLNDWALKIVNGLALRSSCISALNSQREMEA